MIQAESSRLSAPWQSLFRLVWGATALLALGSLIVGSPARYIELHSLCPEASCPDFERLTQESLHSLEGMGLSLGFYATYLTGLTASGALAGLFVGALLAWRKPGYQAAAVFAVVLPLSSMLSYQPIEQLASSWLIYMVSIVQAGSLLLFLLLFPDGHFTPRWTRSLIPAWAALNLTRAIPNSPLNHVQLLDDLQWFTTIILATGSQIYRYMRVSGSVQRHQTRWLVFVIFLLMAVEIPLILIPPAKGSLLNGRLVNADLFFQNSASF